MHTYCLLNTGVIMIIYGEDSRKEEYAVYPLNGIPSNYMMVSYNDIKMIDTNLNYLSLFQWN